MIVTIDGPAGAGKSTAARLLAQRLGYDFLDTGATYRAVTLAVQRAGIAIDDTREIEALLAELRIEMTAGRTYLQGEDVSQLIRTPEVTAASRAVADSPLVRKHLSALQRRIAEGKNLVTEGRDQGTLVFPRAECKFFVTASPHSRAARRHRELLTRGEAVSIEQVLQAQEERDARDAARAIAPMQPAADAILIDTTGQSIEEVVATLERHVLARRR